MKNTLNKMTPYLFFGILIIYILNGYKIINTFEIIFDRHVNTKLSGESKFVDFFYFIFSVAALCISCFYYLLIKLLCRLLPIRLFCCQPPFLTGLFGITLSYFFFFATFSRTPDIPSCPHFLSAFCPFALLQSGSAHYSHNFFRNFRSISIPLQTQKIPLGTQNAYRKTVRLRG